MKLIVGLGNPGPEYDFSPHNFGFAVVRRLAERHSVRLTRRQARSLCGRFLFGSEEVWLIQPQTFMNLSGQSVKQWLARESCGPQDLAVIADDLDLPWGKLRIRQRGSAGGHHGLESVIDSIGTSQFTRLRIGVAPQRPVEDPVEYLLAPLPRPLRREAENITERAADAVETILREGASKAMTRFNRSDSDLETAPSPEGKRQRLAQ